MLITRDLVYIICHNHRTEYYTAIKKNEEGWKQHKCPLTDEWINPVWYTHTMEYYSAMKRK